MRHRCTLHAVLVLAAVLGAAGAGAGEPDALRIEPATVTVAAGRSLQFSLLLPLDDGSVSTPAGARWEATGGRIDAAGLFVAGRVGGHFAVTALYGRHRATARVRVLPAPGKRLRILRVQVVPRIAKVRAGKTVQFRALGYAGQDKPVPLEAAWAVSGGGTITEGGLLHALEAGNYRVTARDPGSGRSGQAMVAIGGVPAGKPVRLAVLPADARVPTGGQWPFRAQGYDAYGTPVVCDLVWQATGGRVDAKGVYHAGEKVGRFTVTARDKATGLTSTARITVLKPEQKP